MTIAGRVSCQYYEENFMDCVAVLLLLEIRTVAWYNEEDFLGKSEKKNIFSLNKGGLLMRNKKSKIVVSLKLILIFLAGFLLWKYALMGINVIAQKYNVDSLWTVILSRFALLGYLLPFVIWFFLEPHTMYGFHFGDTKSSIRMPCIWYGIKDNVRRVCIIFSMLCLVFAGGLFFVKQISFTVILTGLAFAVANSVLEELLWRGYILGRTIQLCGEKFGLILMSLTFGLYHYPLGFSIPICLLFSLGGIYFGGIAIRSKGLLLGVMMHISMNVLFVALGIIF